MATLILATPMGRPWGTENCQSTSADRRLVPTQKRGRTSCGPFFLWTGPCAEGCLTACWSPHGGKSTARMSGLCAPPDTLSARDHAHSATSTKRTAPASQDTTHAATCVRGLQALGTLLIRRELFMRPHRRHACRQSTSGPALACSPTSSCVLSPPRAAWPWFAPEPCCQSHASNRH